MSENPRETDQADPKADLEGESLETTGEGEATSEPEVFQVGELTFTNEELVGWKKSADDVKSFQADYSRKTAAAADQVKVAQATVEKYTSAVSEFESHVDSLQQVILSEEESINWDELAEEDPAQFLKQQKRLEKKRGTLAKAKEKAANAKKDADQAGVAEENLKLRELVPEWYDATGGTTKAQKDELAVILPYLEGKGFTNENMNGPLLARNWAVYRDAAKFHALQQKKPEVTKLVNKTKQVKGGVSKVSKSSNDVVNLFYKEV